MKLFLDGIRFLYNLMQQLPHIESTYYLHFAGLLLIFCFLSSLENQYTIHHVLNSLYGIFNMSVKLNQNQNRFLSLIFLNYLNILNEVTQRVH